MKSPKGASFRELSGTYQKRVAWTTEEDARLGELVNRYGTSSWPDIAAEMPGRTSKSCSLRWRCFLNPDLKRPSDDPLTEWEVAVIVEGQRTYGNRWTLIASLLPGRCNNDIKNYFNLYLKHQVPSGAVRNNYLERHLTLQDLLREAPPEVRAKEQAAQAAAAAQNNAATSSPQACSSSHYTDGQDYTDVQGGMMASLPAMSMMGTGQGCGMPAFGAPYPSSLPQHSGSSGSMKRKINCLSRDAPMGPSAMMAGLPMMQMPMGLSNGSFSSPHSNGSDYGMATSGIRAPGGGGCINSGCEVMSHGDYMDPFSPYQMQHAMAQDAAPARSPLGMPPTANPPGIKSASFCVAPSGGHPVLTVATRVAAGNGAGAGGDISSPFAAAAAGGGQGLPDPELFGTYPMDLLSDGEDDMLGTGRPARRMKRHKSAPASAALPDLENAGSPSLMAAAGAWMDSLIGSGVPGSLGLDDAVINAAAAAATTDAATAAVAAAAVGSPAMAHVQAPLPAVQTMQMRPQALELGGGPAGVQSAPAMGGRCSPSPSPSPAPMSALRVGGVMIAKHEEPLFRELLSGAVAEMERDMSVMGGGHGTFGPASATAASWAPGSSPHGAYLGAPAPLFGGMRSGLGMGMAPAYADSHSVAPTPRPFTPPALLTPAAAAAAAAAAVHQHQLQQAQKQSPLGKGDGCSDGGSGRISRGTGRERSSIASGATTDGMFMFGGSHSFTGNSACYGSTHSPAGPSPSHLHAMQQSPFQQPQHQQMQQQQTRLGPQMSLDAVQIHGANSVGCGDLLLDPSWGEDLELPPQHMELLEDMLRAG